MSYIYGIVDLSETNVKPEEIEVLELAVKWEGSVAQIQTDKHFALGYCTHPERQPKAGIYIEERLAILADIRIYNTTELKRHFDFQSPEEAFAKAYQYWGIQCANHINGDFAVVLIDRKKNEVHLFRDHIGARPLVYWFKENRLVFASHEFGLAKSGLVTTSLSEEKLIDRFFRSTGNYSQTVFQNILKVIPGYCFSFSPNRKRTTKYWKPEEIRKNKDLTFNDSVARMRQLMVSATLNRMEPGKTGAHVSGGIDSTGLASILADQIEDKAQLTGYSWTPEELQGEFEGIDEKEFIEAFSTEKGVLVKYLKLEENESVKDLLIPEFEQMNIERPIMKMAGEDGVKTLFSGWGGDEFVSLSTRGTFNHLFFSFKWLSLMRFVQKKGIKSSIYLFLSDVLPLLIPFELIHSYKAEYTDWSKLRLLKPFLVLKHCKLIIFHSRKNVYGYGNRTRFMMNLLGNYHIPERMDSWSMHAEQYGFEYKYPLLDKDVLEFWFSIPIEYTYQDFHSRLLYREALKGILTEKIRIRNDKGEGLRVAYSLRELQNGKKYLADLFYSLPKQDHLPFFRLEAFSKIINQPWSKEPLKNVRAMNKLTIYLRYVALVKNYLSANQDLIKT